MRNSNRTHALGKMPLEVQLLDSAGETVDRLEKRANGSIHSARDRG